MCAKKGIFLGLILMMTFSLPVSAQEQIVLPQEELPNESMPPLLDAPNSVQGKAVPFTNRWQPDLSYGWLLDEAFYQNSFMSVGLGYSFSESAGMTLRYMSFTQGLSAYAKEFEGTAANLQFQRASGPKTGFSLSYDYHMLYGKVSFGKNTIVHTRMTLVTEVGMIDYQAKQLPMAVIGLSSSWYFGKHWGTHLDVKGGMRQALDPLSQDLGSATPEPEIGDFATTTKITTMLSLGVHYLF